MSKNTIPTPEQPQDNNQLEGASYQILQKRLLDAAGSLREKLAGLNGSRKDIFGAIETKLLATERVSTEHNCVAQDMSPVGKRPVGESFIFGYNVQMGLKQEMDLADVFSIYRYEEKSFHPETLDILKQGSFAEDFKNLYKYYKETRFVKFVKQGVHLHMVFRVGKSEGDIKTFKWLLEGDSLKYIDNRSEHEIKTPAQQEFRWKKTTRDQQRAGRFPHISIEDRVFVETLGGDLTIKVEDNTEKGQGIYTEPVEFPDQTLDDAEVFYALLDNLTVLKVRPYNEKEWRYFVYNAKLQQVKRIDSLGQAALLLPDDQGLLFPDGYYLQTGEYKRFDMPEGKAMRFEKRIISPNGEDVLFVFFNAAEGLYLLLPYNLIEQEIDTPIYCHGYSIFENGEMLFFRGDDEPTRHHTIQIWQTPYVGPNYQMGQANDSYLFKIGNKEVVRAMAEANQLIGLLEKEDNYAGLYHDLIKSATALLDHYHWLGHAEAYELETPLRLVRQTANSALDEFEKVRSIKKSTEEQTGKTLSEADGLLRNIKRERPRHILDFVAQLNALRRLRGEVISLKDLRYVQLAPVEGAEQLLKDAADSVARACVRFLLQDDALQPYQQKLDELGQQVEKAPKVAELNALLEEADTLAGELEMLLEVVGNLKIEDATQTTQIIDNVSALYAGLNATRTRLRNRKKELQRAEGAAEFSAQLKLVDQSVINYLDVCDTPAKVEEYLTRVMVQLEELEGKFSEFDEFLDKLATKREEVYAAFENKKVALTEARNKRAVTLHGAGERIISAVKSRLGRFKEVNEINGYLAGDLMVEKLRGIIADLQELGDTVKSDDLKSQLQALRDESLRQLKDRKELYADGENTIKFGKWIFSVNKQPLELTTLLRPDGWYYHLTGTAYFEKIKADSLKGTEAVWQQNLVSENEQVYRAEYLAYQFLKSVREGKLETSLTELQQFTIDELLTAVQKFSAGRFDEGYVKGVHDKDAARLLTHLLTMESTVGLLKYAPPTRTLAHIGWLVFMPKSTREALEGQLTGAGEILKVFPSANGFASVRNQLEKHLVQFAEETELFLAEEAFEAAQYLFEALSGAGFVVDNFAMQLKEQFLADLKKNGGLNAFESSIKKLQDQPAAAYSLLRQWAGAWLESAEAENFWLDELASLLWPELRDTLQNAVNVNLSDTIQEMAGEHALIREQQYKLGYHQFWHKLQQHESTTVPLYRQLTQAKKLLIKEGAENLRLEEFKPRVMSSFVRNKLIDEVYLPLIGANLAKQIGTAGDTSRVDRQGMLLLISPPGYGKTTLMEYLADRLGLIFMKINGPAIGHDITSIDPSEAKNAGARQELEKLNLSFEMGDNVMIYLDDIQHCNPEFLQKFISLCDGQRKIEGIWKGRSKTYDFRGRRVAVVMAGNPYTESGEKFRIPDMLANRADIYNLGDILGDSDTAFKLSYLENSFTANPAVARIATKSHKDAVAIIKMAMHGENQAETPQWEANHDPSEISEAVSVLKKLLKIRDVVLRVNEEYIHSAGQADEYRTEPAFKLQGSYRNMNKLGEKVAPVMNEQELDTLILSHYESEAQTLTTGAEANLLKFKDMMNWLSQEEKERWADIKAIFKKQQQLKGLGGNHMAQLMAQVENVSHALYGIRAALAAGSKLNGVEKEK
jgi:hypothetical protein